MHGLTMKEELEPRDEKMRVWIPHNSWHENTLYLAVWRRNGNTPVKTLPIPSLAGKKEDEV